MSHEAVADCCVVGVYDGSQASEFPRAYIVLQPSFPNDLATVNTISKFVADNVVSYKRLSGGVRVIQHVPKSASGKILRRIVKEWVKTEQQETPSKSRL
jgi:acyl-coenzyme A synthetase/AMP-(fatty) acid ligase